MTLRRPMRRSGPRVSRLGIRDRTSGRLGYFATDPSQGIRTGKVGVTTDRPSVRLGCGRSNVVVAQRDCELSCLGRPRVGLGWS
jgi:hypothetical protein